MWCCNNDYVYHIKFIENYEIDWVKYMPTIILSVKNESNIFVGVWYVYLLKTTKLKVLDRRNNFELWYYFSKAE